MPTEPEQPDWSPPPIQVKWRSYFAPGAEEQKPVVEMVTLAKNAGLVDQRKAVEAIAQIFGIENIAAYLETLEKERAENDAREQENAANEAAALHQIANGGGKPGAKGQPAGKAPAARHGSGRPGASAQSSKEGD